VLNGVEFSLDEMKPVRVLGTGRFGFVRLVQRESTNMAYALKVLSKEALDNLQQQKYAFTERDILQSIDHPFFPAIYATFQDLDSIYMLMEFVPGGDLWAVMYDPTHHTKLGPPTRLGGLQTNVAKFYAANVLCALAHLHSKDIIYRDLKPENLVSVCMYVCMDG
jgi:protein kinase A